MKRILKYTLYLILTLATLVTLVVAYLHFSDEELNPTIKDIVDKAHANSTVYSRDNAFIYLYSMDAPDDVRDTYEFGKNIIKEIQSNPEYESTYPRKNLPLKIELCQEYTQLADCLVDQYANQPELTNKLLKESHLILKRYFEYAKKTENTNLLVRQPFRIPGFQNIVYGRKLSSIYALELIQKNENTLAYTLLTLDIAKSREQLGRADTLIQKMIAIVNISRQLDVLSAFSQSGEFTTLHKEQGLGVLDDLTPAELSYDVFLTGEFLFSYHLLTENNHYSWSERTLMRLAGGPNLFLNHHFDSFQRLASLPTNPAEYLSARHSLLSKAINFKPSLRKRIALISLGLDTIEELYIHYTDRLMTLNNKLKLLRITLTHDIITPEILAQYPSDIDGRFARLESNDSDRNTSNQLSRLCYPHFVPDETIYNKM